MRTKDTIAGRRFYARSFAIAAAAILAFLTFRILQPLVVPLCWAALLAFLLHPAQVRLTARLRGHSSVAAIVLTLATFAVVLGPLSALMAAFGVEVTALLEFIQERLGNGGAPRMPELSDVPLAGAPLDELRRTLGISTARVEDWILVALRNVLQFLGTLSGKLVIGALGTMMAFAFVIILLFFGLRDGEHIVAGAGRLIPLPMPVKNHLGQHLGEVIRAVVFGTGVTATVQGTLVGLAFAVLGLPGPVVFGVIAALAAMIPMGGSALVWGPAVLALLVQQRWGAAAGLAAWGSLLVGTVDNLLRPLLVSGRAHISALTIFVGVIGGIASFGIIGFVIGPVTLALVIALLRFMRDGRVVPKLPAPTRAKADASSGTQETDPRGG